MANEGNALGRVNPGDPLRLPAQTFNIFCDTAEEVARMRKQNAAGVPQGRDVNTTLVTIRNDTGGDLDRFSIVGLGDPLIDNSDNLAEFKNRITFKGETPDLDAHRGKFAILMEPIADGKLGKAAIAGVCQVLINVGDADHCFAEIEDGQSGRLLSGASGSAQILWKESGTGVGKWGLVRFGPGLRQQARWIRFSLDAALLFTDMSRTATVLEFWDGDDPDPEAAGVTVQNCALGGSVYLFAGAAGAIGLACYEPGYDRYRIVNLQCG